MVLRIATSSGVSGGMPKMDHVGFELNQPRIEHLVRLSLELGRKKSNSNTAAAYHKIAAVWRTIDHLRVYLQVFLSSSSDQSP